LTSEATRTTRPAIASPDGGRFEFSPHNCFACGTLNTGGLGLVLHVEPGRSWTELALDRRFEGWEGMAHGGILCTILDEVMAWALVGEDNWGVTARMAVEFRRPVSVGGAIRAEGWITRSRRRVVDTAARIVDVETGAELATATGVYVAADPARKRDLRERYGFRAIAPDPPSAPATDPGEPRDPADGPAR
jgi:acyl-coenzyme A thioesterase PaaI-like protein